ncbi:hypothetical protein ACLOJK_031075 [Asimina triloba]
MELPTVQTLDDSGVNCWRFEPQFPKSKTSRPDLSIQRSPSVYKVIVWGEHTVGVKRTRTRCIQHANALAKVDTFCYSVPSLYTQDRHWGLIFDFGPSKLRKRLEHFSAHGMFNTLVRIDVGRPTIRSSGLQAQVPKPGMDGEAACQMKMGVGGGGF